MGAAVAEVDILEMYCTARLQSSFEMVWWKKAIENAMQQESKKQELNKFPIQI